MNFWQYIMAPTGTSFGLVAINMLIVSALGVFIGIALIKLPQEFARGLTSPIWGRAKAGHEQIGKEEHKLRVELRVKAGIGITIWCLTLILSLVLRLLGTAGLETRFLPAMVLLTLPILISYFAVYRLFFFSRFLKASRLLDRQKSYEPRKKGKKRIVSQEEAHTLPGKALIGLLIMPLLYYIVMIAVSIPPGVPAQNHDHLLHQFGMSVMSMLGYLLGLVMSLGDDFRPLLPWLQTSRK